jgi:sulfonate transport system ATP-binding protein
MTSLAFSAPLGLRLSGVGKTFVARGENRRALAGIDLELAASEIIAIVGASGCGKSTLLRIVAGLERHHEGEVWVGGRRVEGPGRDRGLVFQEHRLLPWLTVGENVGFGLDDVPAARRGSIVSELLDLVGLPGRERSYPHELSGGMAQRAALARALAPAPSVLLLDEPFAALDAITKPKLQAELLRIHAVTRPTLLVVTHDIEEAVFLSDRIVVLSRAPGTLRAVLPIELSPPRDRTSEAFSRYRRAVLQEFPEETHDLQAQSIAPSAPPPDPRRLLLEREARGDSPELRHV